MPAVIKNQVQRVYELRNGQYVDLETGDVLALTDREMRAMKNAPRVTMLVFPGDKMA